MKELKMKRTARLPIVLHAGYHKTATTYLQRTVFSGHPEIHYLGKPWITADLQRIIYEWQFTPSLQFDPATIAKGLDPYTLAERNGKTIALLSQESLHSGPEWDGRHVVEMAQRMKAVLPNARLLLTIRNQTKYIESIYKNYVHLGGKLPFKKYIYDSFHARCGHFSKLEYDRVIALYRSLFGAESVSS